MNKSQAVIPTKAGNQLNELPKGWRLVPLGKLRGDTAKSINPSEQPDEIFELYSVPSFSDGVPEVITGKEIGSSKKVVEPNTVLLSKINPRINRVWIVGQAGKHKQISSPEWVEFFPTNDVEPKYLMYFMQNNKFREHLSMNVSGVGGSLTRIRPKVAEDYGIPLAPKEQQKRIVAKIEELFSHIDAGIEALKKAKQLLKQYRQSVHKAAVTGELTKEWREANKGKQNSSKLLKEKLLELKVEHNKSLIARWEKAKEQWKLEGEIGKRPGKPKINDSLEEVYDEIIEELPPIPDEWCWIMMGDISDAIDPQPSHRTPSVVEGGIPYVGIGDVDKTNGNIDFENARQVSPDVLVEHKIRYDLKEGDFIIGKIGTIGKPFQIPTERFYTLSANVVLVRPIGELANPNYLFNLCKSPVVERQFESGSKATTQAAFGIKKVRLLAVPYCSLAEQAEIVKNLEDCLMRASRLEDELDRQIKMAEKNKKSVLASAFIGKLQ